MQRVKLQAEVLVPVLRHLRAELGESAANALIFPVIRARMKTWIAELASSSTGNPIEDWQTTSDRLEALFQGDVDWTVVEHDEDRLHFDVTACRFADFFRQLGEPELGAILTCELDDHIAALFAPAVRFSRPETIMKGASLCPFRYRFGSRNPPD